MNIKQEFITPNKYTRPQIRMQKVNAAAIHYAGDPGASAQNIRDYFNGTCIRAKRYASCHYAVGMQGEVIQLIPESEWSYCTNQRNKDTISIETCHADTTGKFSQAAETSLVALAAQICKRYGLNPLSGGVIRHFDVTGKHCPKYYVDHPDAWAAFKTAVSNCMAGKPFVLPSYGTTVGAAAVNPDFCDTGSLTVCLGMEYQFKSGSPITCANSSFARVAHQIGSDGYHYTKFRAHALTAGVGFYANGRRVCIAIVKRPYSDTTAPFTKRLGETYCFKTDFPIICGTGSVFLQTKPAEKFGRFLLTTFKAVGRGSAGFYCGSTRVCVGTVK
jgi:hypothetical protein